MLRISDMKAMVIHILSTFTKKLSQENNKVFMENEINSWNVF